MKLFLIGYMGAGKSTVGKSLAPIFNLKFIDLDYYIEDKYKTKISSIFREKGEEYFREIEHLSLIEIITNQDDFILSVGGGTPVFFDNMDIMNDNGLTVYLKLNPKVLFHRLQKSYKKRPLIQNLSGNELLNYIESNLNKREVFYNKAKLKIEGLNLNKKKLADSINNYLKSF